MKTITPVVVGFLMLIPSVSIAEEKPGQEQMRLLQQQIVLLLEEVSKLQEALSGVSSTRTEMSKLDNSEIQEIIEQSANWFKNAQEDSGHMRYEYVPYSNEYVNDDNIVRQAGSLYALGEVLLADTEEKLDLKDTVIKSISYFENLSVDGSYGGKSFRCIANSSVNDTCQLGATSLALVGVIDLVERYPLLEEDYSTLIEDYGQYLLAMKKEGSGFRNIFIEGGNITERESSFSNGEALLALVRLHRYSPSDETRQVIEDTFTYFESEEVPFDFPLYLWVMAALKDVSGIIPEDRYIKYAQDYTQWRVNGFLYRKGSTHNMCAYTEGVGSAMAVLKGKISQSAEEKFEYELTYWHDRLKNLQILESDTFRILKNEEGGLSFGKLEQPLRAVGGFLTNENTPTQRIDYTQHCMNSYLQQLVLLDNAKL